MKWASGWRDTTDDTDSNASGAVPWTFAKSDGVGAFQVAVATYLSGSVPNPNGADLKAMIVDFATSRRLGEAREFVVENGRLALASATFLHEGDFIRVWYVSDGRNFAKATYLCVSGREVAELTECESMIRTLKFKVPAT